MSVENRIRDLADKAVSASDQESNQVLDELRSAIHEHTAQTRAIMRASYPKRGLDSGLSEKPAHGRRKTDAAVQPPKTHSTEAAESTGNRKPGADSEP